MFEVRKRAQKPNVVIRSVTAAELYNYEKRKATDIEDGTKINKIEAIKLDNQRVQINPLDKEAKIDLVNHLAFKSNVIPETCSAEELFFIKCEVDDTYL